ncbi:MAG: histidine phosphotransferase family protein [Amphiplicatus sp.]
MHHAKASFMSVSHSAPDPVALSSLIASRVCHDLINPVGAIGSGLDVLDDASMDQAMREAALDLVRSGGEKAVSILKFARLAYGVAGGYGAEIALEEAEALLRDIFRWSKAALEWRLKPGLVSKEKAKTLLMLTQAAADCAPRGGTVTVSGGGDAFLIEAVGPRLILHDEFRAALAGDARDLKPKFAPAYLAGLMARESGGGIVADMTDEKATIEARFGRPPA